MNNIGKIAIAIVIVIIAVILSTSFTSVRPGKVGVVTHFGKVSKTTLPEGLHFVMPIQTKVIQLDTRIQKVEIDATASSKDLQNVTSTVALNYRLSKPRAADIFQNLGLNYKDNIIHPTIQESIKSATANFTAEELITKRPLVKEAVFKYVKKRLGENNIIVTDFSIVDFSFSAEFNRAIESKEVAKQKALTAKNDLERIKTEADQARERARGQADAQALLKEALDDKLLQLKTIEKWNGILPVVQGEGSGAFVDINGLMKTQRR